MTPKETRLFRMMLLMFLGYILPFVILPALLNLYQAQSQSIESLEDSIQRYEKLKERADELARLHTELIKERNKINSGLLMGDTKEIVGARMQGNLKQLIQSHGINLKSTEKAEFVRTGDWLFITQAITFEANPNALVDFLQAVQNTKEKLIIISLNIRSNVNLLEGVIKITGFSYQPAATETDISTS